MSSNLRINGDRLWKSLMTMAEIGATDKGGCNRQALTDEDKIGRDLFVSWCRKAGCSIRIDQMGNIFARLAGRDDTLAPVITGSHLDTQPTGGKFDGVYGVLAGLEVLRTLNDGDVVTEAPLEVVVWTNEEGARFSPAMIGSGVWAGQFDLQASHGIADRQGNTIGDELARIGYLGDETAASFPIKAAFEVHIEQGPILEQEGLQIGVISGVQGMRWYDLTIEGQPCHAGPTPMEVRRDPFQGISKIIQQLYALAEQHGPWARATFGDIKAEPGARNTVPERVVLAVDLRHPQQETLDLMDASFRTMVQETCAELKLEGSIRDEWNSPAVKFDDNCISSVRDATDMLGYPSMEMFSGAGHDSVYVSTVAPTSMIFVPCEGGLSHNEAENATLEDLEAGCNVLLHSMLDRAGIVTD
jgi:N-carbamoyl-L-amino-acid hydrolase